MVLLDIKQSLLRRLPWNTPALTPDTQVNKAAYRAYETFVQQNPRWKESFFDEYFLKTRIIPMLTYAAKQKKQLHPLLLARAFMEQFTNTCNVRMEMLLKIEPIMKSFMKLYQKEFGGLK